MTHITIATSAGVPPAREIQARTKKRTTIGRRPNQADPRLLREDHFLCVIMDTVLAAQAAVKRWLDRRRTRQALATLDEHLLRDIGLIREADRAKRLAHHESKGQSSHVPTSAIFFAGR
jgi:uncharacterized protein YjiS (DUF1127 family)